MEKIRNAPKGERNNTLNYEVGQVVSKYTSARKDPKILYNVFKEVGLEIGLNEEEIIPTLQSAFGYGETQPDKKTIRDQLYQLALESIDDMVLSNEGDYYIRTSEKVIAVNTRSKETLAWITGLYKDFFARIPNLHDLTATINALMADIAREKPRPVYIRTAQEDQDSIAIDLGEQKWINLNHENITIKK